jgi:hypothetical protein
MTDFILIERSSDLGVGLPKEKLAVLPKRNQSTARDTEGALAERLWGKLTDSLSLTIALDDVAIVTRSAMFASSPHHVTVEVL